MIFALMMLGLFGIFGNLVLEIIFKEPVFTFGGIASIYLFCLGAAALRGVRR